MKRTDQPVIVSGAGPTGSLLAILLRRRGFPVTVYERRPDPRRASHDSGRSINLALAERGIHALRQAGLHTRIFDEMIPMRGRMIHEVSGATFMQPYGQRPHEVIYSIARGRLNNLLIDQAIESFGADIHFEREVTHVDPARLKARIRDRRDPGEFEVPAAPLLVAEGAGSATRNSLVASGSVSVRLEPLEHVYKELTIPAGADGGHRLEREALHIWPRGNFMLIALPNLDGSFTATLFLQRERIEELKTPADIERFFGRHFPDAAAMMPSLVEEFLGHPTGALGTVYSTPWHERGSVLLLGDAAHAIVPFHGQGMNCCFEDCVELDALLDHHEDWETLFVEFERRRRPNTDAIAAMALENYLEMRERVADARFQLQKTLSSELEQRHPGRFIPRYSMVTFHHDIGYATAWERGRIQQGILDELTTHCTELSRVDFEAAAQLIEARLPVL